MANLKVNLQTPAGTKYEITDKLLGAPGINPNVEDNLFVFDAGTLDLEVDDADGFFTGLLGGTLDGSLKWDYVTSKGTWYVEILKNGTDVSWCGDIDVKTVFLNEEEKTCKFSVLGVLSRALQFDAETLQRVTTDPIYFTNERNKRVLTLWQDLAHTIPLAVSGTGLAVEDRIKTEKLTRNARVVDQELEIRHLGPSSTPLLTAYQVKVRQRCKREYAQGVCATPWWKGLTVGACVLKCLQAMGVTSYEIAGTGTTYVVQELDTEGKKVSEVLAELAEYGTCVLFNVGNQWCFLDRQQVRSGASSKPVDSLICSWESQGLKDRYYLTIKVTGRPPHFAPESTPRSCRVGQTTTPNLTFEIETDFTDDIDTLKTIGGHAYDEFAYRRRLVEVKVLDDGTAYHLWDEITRSSVAWRILRISEPVFSVCDYTVAGSSVPIRDMITLLVEEKVGVAPTTATYSEYNRNKDDDPPYPPEYVEASSAKLSKRKAWWSLFRVRFPGTNPEFAPRKWEKLKKVINEGTADEEEIEYWQEYILWAVRAKMPTDYGVDVQQDTPDELILTCFTDDPSNPRRHKRFPNCQPDADGWYYSYFYKPITSSPVEWFIAVQTYEWGKDLSAYSDEVSTLADDEGESPVYPAPVIEEPATFQSGVGMNLIVKYGGTDTSDPNYNTVPTKIKIWLSQTGTFSSTYYQYYGVPTTFDTANHRVLVPCAYYNNGSGTNQALTSDCTCYIKVQLEYDTDVFTEESAVFVHTFLATTYQTPLRKSISYVESTGVVTVKWTFSNAIASGDNVKGFAIFNPYKAVVRPDLTCDGYTPATYPITNNWVRLGSTPYTFDVTTAVESGENVFTKTFTLDTYLTEFSIDLCCGDGSADWGDWALAFPYGTTDTTQPPAPVFTQVSGQTYKITWSGSGRYYLHLQIAVGAMYTDIVTPENVSNTKVASGGYSYTFSLNQTYRVRLCDVADDEVGQVADYWHSEWVGKTFSQTGPIEK